MADPTGIEDQVCRHDLESWPCDVESDIRAWGREEGLIL